ncbi:uncharacterized protein LOC110038484 isoform X2 [Phalaenopsis equestris]|uniref:uncharacterized protein LOC110038484 isoform X2 n=1 Tax=Phalaenopsis equestris TaxID=78828 RepID=UPI0009E4F231|nr:uncharacterized protein LOC110038484 isoform X2 [Phalaenopsis equestris]
MASPSSSVSSTPAPSAAKKSFLRRILPALLVANVAVGGGLSTTMHTSATSHVYGYDYAVIFFYVNSIPLFSTNLYAVVICHFMYFYGLQRKKKIRMIRRMGKLHLLQLQLQMLQFLSRQNLKVLYP